MDRTAPATSFSEQDWAWNTWGNAATETAGKPHFLGIVIILGSGITLGIFPVPWGSAGCLRAREGGVPRPAPSHGPGSKQGTVLRLHVQSLQLHYWITLTGRPLVSYFITWVKKKWAGRVKMCILSQRTPAREAATEAAKKHFCGARWKDLCQVKIPKVWDFLMSFWKPIKISQITVQSFPLKSMLTFLCVVTVTLWYIRASIPLTWNVCSSCTYISVTRGDNRECPSRRPSQRTGIALLRLKTERW